MAVTRIKAYHGIGAAVDNSLSYITNEEKTDMSKWKAIQNAFDYASNPEKTTFSDIFSDINMNGQTVENIPLYDGDISSGQQLVSGYMCDPEFASKQFQLAMDLYHQNHRENLSYQTSKRLFRAKLDSMGNPILDDNGKMVYDPKAPVYHDENGKCIYESYKKQTQARTAYMWVLSFAPERVCGFKIDPRICHQIGLEFMKKIGDGQFQAVVATHMDREHPHDYIVMCAYAMDGSHKYRDTKDTLMEARRICDDLSEKFGLPILPSISKEQSKSISWTEWKARQEGQSWKEQMRQDINGAIRVAADYKQFIEIMKSSGYQLRETENHFTYIMPGDDEFKCRDIKLGKEYEKNAIKAYFNKKHDMQKTLARGRSKNSEDYELVHNTHEKPIHIHVSRYTFSGRRRSDLEMVFLVAIRLLQAMRDRFRNHETGKAQPAEPAYKDYTWKLRQMIDSLKLIQDMKIESIEQLMSQINESGKKLSIAKKETNDLEIGLHYAEEIVDLINEAERYQAEAQKIGFDMSWLYISKPDTMTIRENLAKENPASPTQRRELYLLLQKYSEQYHLGCKYDKLNAREAQEIILYLQDKSSNKPEILLNNNERILYQSDSIKTQPGNDDVLFQNRLLDYDPSAQQMIARLRSVMQQLADLGIEADDFDKERRKLQSELDIAYDKQRELENLKQEYKNLRRIKYNYTIAANHAFSREEISKKDRATHQSAATAVFADALMQSALSATIDQYA